MRTVKLHAVGQSPGVIQDDRFTCFELRALPFLVIRYVRPEGVVTAADELLGVRPRFLWASTLRVQMENRQRESRTINFAFMCWRPAK